MRKMSENEMLSQQEIDALLAGGGADEDGSTGDETAEDELSEFEKDALGEIGNITFGSASTALSTILGQKVEITTPEVRLVLANELNVEFPKPHVVVSVNYTEGFSGTNMLVIKTMDAAIIADLMMGGSGEVADDTLTELHTSAVQEAMNQMMGSAATSMSTIFDELVNISPPNVDILDFESSDEPQQSLEEETLVKVAFRLTVGDLIDSYIMQLLPLSFAKEMTERLSAQTSAELSQTEVERASEQSQAEAEAAASAEVKAPPQPQQAMSAKQDVPSHESRPQMPEYTASQSTDVPKSRNPQLARDVQTAEFAPITDHPIDNENVDFDLFMDIPLDVTVELGRTKKSIQQLLSISPGSVIELDKLAGEPVDILVNHKLVARGEVVVVDENFGVRVTEIHNKKVRLEKMQ